jgi:hypothetical protein
VKAKSLALLTDDYVSPMLLNTLMREEIPVIVRGRRLKEELERFCPGLKLLSKEEALDIISKEDSRLLANAEDLLSCVADRTLDPSRAEGLRQLKDKRRFRELERVAYPDYFFLEAKSNRLKEIELPPGRSYIIKPSSGLKGIGVRMVKERKDLHMVADALVREVEESAEALGKDPLSSGRLLGSDRILSSDRFLIEEFLKGEEFACDAYLSSKGEPVVLGIYAHPLRDEEDFRDIVYYTSSNVMRKILPRVSDFLRKLSAQTGLKGIPLNAEFRLQRNRLMPIEINPLRFGSFSIPDLAFFAFRVNPYKYHYNEQKPEWERILSQEGEEIFFRVLTRLPEGGKRVAGKSADHEEFAATFSRDPIGYCKLDMRRYPAFSIAFGRTNNIDEVLRYLDIDFEDYLS